MLINSVLFFLTELVLLFLLSQKISNAVFALFYRLTKNKSASITFYALLFYPGVMIHELAHLLTASILFVQVGHMEFKPVLDGGGLKLGSVEIARTDPIRRMIIGVAPIIVGTSLLIFALYYLTVLNPIQAWWQGFLTAYILFAIGNTMFSSKKDLEGTVELIIALFVAYVFLIFLGLPLNTFVVSFLNSSIVTQIATIGSIYLSIPIAIDVLVILLTKLAR